MTLRLNVTPEEMYIYSYGLPRDVTRRFGTVQAEEDGATRERQSPVTVYALPLEGFWQKDSSIDQRHCLLGGFQRERKFLAVTAARRRRSS